MGHCIYKFCCFKVLPLFFFLVLLSFLFIHRWAFHYLGSVLCYFGHLNLYRYDAHFLLDSNIYIYKYIKLSRKKNVPGVQVVTVCSRPTVLLPFGYLVPIFFWSHCFITTWLPGTYFFGMTPRKPGPEPRKEYKVVWGPVILELSYTPYLSG